MTLIANQMHFGEPRFNHTTELSVEALSTTMTSTGKSVALQRIESSKPRKYSEQFQLTMQIDSSGDMIAGRIDCWLDISTLFHLRRH